MEKKFDYFYKDSQRSYNYIMMPKILFKDPNFSSLSIEAKSLYSLMLDRVELSMKNGFTDEEDRVYIILTIKEAMELLNVGRNKCIRIFAELDSEKGAGLIERKRRGLGKASVIYVKNVKCTENNESLEEVSKTNFKKSQNETSRGPKNKLQEVPKSNPNNTNINNTDKNKTEYNSYHINSSFEGAAEEILRREGMKELICTNIEYDALRDKYSESELSGLVEIMTDCVLTRNPYVIIGGERMPSAVVRDRFLKLDSAHIEYVIDSFRKNTHGIKNVKAYLIAALYNSYTTLDYYYTARVNHDLYGT